MPTIGPIICGQRPTSPNSACDQPRFSRICAAPPDSIPIGRLADLTAAAKVERQPPYLRPLSHLFERGQSCVDCSITSN